MRVLRWLLLLPGVLLGSLAINALVDGILRGGMALLEWQGKVYVVAIVSGLFGGLSIPMFARLIAPKGAHRRAIWATFACTGCIMVLVLLGTIAEKAMLQGIHYLCIVFACFVATVAISKEG